MRDSLAESASLLFDAASRLIQSRVMTKYETQAIAIFVACSYVLAAGAGSQAQETTAAPTEVVASTPAPPAAAPPSDCRQINTGGPIAGIVVASVFWYVLPMSIPVWITQAKKLKRRKAERWEQAKRGCPTQ